MSEDFDIYSEVAKVDTGLGLVFGWAIVCKENGEMYFDTQGDHIPEESMMKAATDFMVNSRSAVDMHDKEKVLPGSIVFALPLTEEVAKAFDIQTSRTGLIIAMKPESQEILQKFSDGTYTGFSIGGIRISHEEVEDA